MDGLSSSYAMRHVMGRAVRSSTSGSICSAEFFFRVGMSWQPQPRARLRCSSSNAWLTKHDELDGRPAERRSG